MGEMINCQGVLEFKKINVIIKIKKLALEDI
jgi:hypothetical protein